MVYNSPLSDELGVEGNVPRLYKTKCKFSDDQGQLTLTSRATVSAATVSRV
jgi:hypothetical protein